MANGERSPSRRILETAKTLVTAYGQSHAARELNIPLGTICSWAKRYGWKRVIIRRMSANSLSGGQEQSPKALPSETQQECKTPSEAIEQSLRGHRNRSVVALAQWTAEASEEAAQAPEKLANSKRVKDVAQVHSILWPVDTHTTIIDFDILTGVKTVRPASAETVNIESTPSLLALPTPSDRSLEQWTTSPSPTPQDEGTPPTP